MRILVIVAAICVLAASGYEIAEKTGAEPDALIIPIDALSAEGAGATLEARLRHEHGVFNISGETLEFVLKGEVIGKAQTDKDGLASIQYTPPSAGDYVFNVRLAAGSKRTAADASLTLCVRKKEQEFFVTDIDGTISDASNFEMLTKDQKEIPPMKDSPEVLQALSKKYTIIYLTAREDFFRGKTKAWLADNGFPAGPVFFWDIQTDKFGAENYKTALLAKLKADWPNIIAGAGDQVSDADAYKTNGLKAYAFRKEGAKSAEDEKEERAKFPAGTTFFTSWKDLQKILLPEGQ